MMRVAPDWRASVICEGGVRPAIMWPSSVLSFNPARAPSSADACVSGSYRFPVGVRGRFDRGTDPSALAAISFFLFMTPDRGETARAERAGVRCVIKHHTRQMMTCL